MLAAINFRNPLFWGVLAGWVMSVVVHEYAHGLVAYLGGDYTIKERGGLSLNPLRYVDPTMTLVLPILFLLLGGIPLPGGATYIRRDLLRNRVWDVAVSAAGPASNFLIFLALAASLNQRVGWVDYGMPVTSWPAEKLFVAALAFFQLFATLINLFPVPPLDGFQMISPLLGPELRRRLTQPPTGFVILILFFFLAGSSPFFQFMYTLMRPVAEAVGVDFSTLVGAARVALYGYN